MNKLAKLSMALMFGMFVAGCTADVEDPGEMPDVDVQGGEMPDIDVDPARVEIGTDTQMVEVPDIDIEAAE